MPVVQLSAAFLATGLRCPEGKPRVEWCDAEVQGLYIEVRATSKGQGTYYLRYRNAAGKTAHQKLGRTTDIGLTEARRAAKALRAEIAMGADPRGQEKARKEVPTWTDFFDLQYLPFAKPRKRSWKGDVQRNVRIKAKFGHKRLNEITRQEIEKFHIGILDQGLKPASADQHLRLIKRALNLAVQWEVIDKSPGANVKLLRVDNKRETYLDDEQLARLMQILRTDSARTVCQLATFLLATGARLSEALGATWSQIDRPHRIWRIPATNSKSKKMRPVPLNDQALAVLDEVGTEGKFDHVFINHRWKNPDGTMGKPLTWVHKVWERIRNDAGMPGLRIHDLRHSHASFLVNSGRSLYEVQQVLGHSDPSVTMRYAHLSSKTMLEASNTASLMIERAIRTADAAQARKEGAAAGAESAEAPGATSGAQQDTSEVTRDSTQSSDPTTATGVTGATSGPEVGEVEEAVRRAA